MPEDPGKRRLREWKRKVATEWTRKGYCVLAYESGPFHVSLCRGRRETRVRFAFGRISDHDAAQVFRAPAPDRCSREVWEISEDGKAVTIRRFSKM